MPTSQPENDIVFVAKSETPLALGAVFFGAVFLWFLYRVKGISVGTVGILVVMVGAIVWLAIAGSLRRLAFSGGTLRLMSGSKVKDVIELRQVSRLVCRRVRVRHGHNTMYLAVLPDHEVTLFDEKAYKNLPQILQLLETRTGRTVEQEST